VFCNNAVRWRHLAIASGTKARCGIGIDRQRSAASSASLLERCVQPGPLAAAHPARLATTRRQPAFTSTQCSRPHTGQAQLIAVCLLAGGGGAGLSFSPACHCQPGQQAAVGPAYRSRGLDPDSCRRSCPAASSLAAVPLSPLTMCGPTTSGLAHVLTAILTSMLDDQRAVRRLPNSDHYYPASKRTLLTIDATAAKAYVYYR